MPSDDDMLVLHRVHGSLSERLCTRVTMIFKTTHLSPHVLVYEHEAEYWETGIEIHERLEMKAIVIDLQTNMPLSKLQCRL